MPKWKAIDPVAPVAQPLTNLIQGRIKLVTKEKGFGFIVADNGEEFFFHRSSVVPPRAFDYLEPRQVVEFEPQTSAKGPRAESVQQVG